MWGLWQAGKPLGGHGEGPCSGSYSSAMRLRGHHAPDQEREGCGLSSLPGADAENGIGRCCLMGLVVGWNCHPFATTPPVTPSVKPLLNAELYRKIVVFRAIQSATASRRFELFKDLINGACGDDCLAFQGRGRLEKDSG